MLRRLGQWSGKIRRAAADLRAQSGIDDALRSEGLADDIAEIRKLARGELDGIRNVARFDEPSAPKPVVQEHYGRGDDFYVVRDREYPREGADAYGALPDNAIVYAEGLAKGPLARDPLYVLGDANGELPPEPVAAPVDEGSMTLDPAPGGPAPETTEASHSTATESMETNADPTGEQRQEAR